MEQIGEDDSYGIFCDYGIGVTRVAVYSSEERCMEELKDLRTITRTRTALKCGRKKVVECEYYEIDPETICQYIGETDKEGKKIFEGDIIGFITLGSTESGYSKSSCLGEVVWSKEICCFHVTNRLSAESWEVLAGCKVLGNVFDNTQRSNDFLDLYTGWPTI